MEVFSFKKSEQLKIPSSLLLSAKQPRIRHSQRNGRLVAVLAFQQADGIFSFDHNVLDGIIVDTRRQARTSAPVVLIHTGFYLVHGVVIVISGKHVEFLFLFPQFGDLRKQVIHPASMPTAMASDATSCFFDGELFC